MFVLRYTIVRVKKNAFLCARVQPRLTPETNTLATEGIQRCGAVRLTGASSGANSTKQELFNTELAPAEYQIIPALLG